MEKVARGLGIKGKGEIYTRRRAIGIGWLP
jgi:hypothetical protein